MIESMRCARCDTPLDPHTLGGMCPVCLLNEPTAGEGVLPTISADATLLCFSIGETIHLLRSDTGEAIAMLDSAAPLTTIRLRFNRR